MRVVFLIGITNGTVGVAMGVLILTFLASSVFKTVYGRELFVTSVTAEVNSHSVPDNFAQAWVRTIKPSRPLRLRHGLYDDPTCATLLAEWLWRRLLSDPNAPFLQGLPRSRGFDMARAAWLEFVAARRGQF